MSIRKRKPDQANIILVPLDKLKKSPSNVRKIKHAKADITALAASIGAVGMLQFPVVEAECGSGGKPTGSYLVTAGEGRRLAQLLRAKRKEIAKAEPIPCILDTARNATEISLAENAVRAAMHPADEYEAFAELNTQHGMTADDIAGRFGVTAAVVRQRLKLGAVSPRLLGLYRKGEMNLEQLTAFAITDDHARQEQVWEDLGFHNSRHAILQALTEGQVPLGDRRALFVGLKDYEAAGGHVVRDLFDDEGGYLTDTALLNRLVRDKLQRTAEAVIAEGWKWVVVEPEFDYQRAAAMATLDTEPRALTADEQEKLESLEARLVTLSAEAEQDDASDDMFEQIEALESEIEALTEEVYRAEDISRAGAFVVLGREGKVSIKRGYLQAEDVRREEAKDSEDEAAIPGPKDSGGLSAALVAELTAHRTMALRNDLAQAPDLALIGVTHALAARCFYPSQDLSCLQVFARQTSLVPLASNIEDGAAGQAIAVRHEAWARRMPNEAAALWSFVASLNACDLLSLLAHCASLSLDAVQRPGSSQPEKLGHASELARAMPHQMSRYWQPTVASYLGRVSKERIVEAVREGAGEEAARKILGLKKQAMAQRAEELLVGKDWLPPVLLPTAATASA